MRRTIALTSGCKLWGDREVPCPMSHVTECLSEEPRRTKIGNSTGSDARFPHTDIGR